MRLITGPAGSGKTSAILDAVRACLRENSKGLRVLVPTATLAQHLRNRLAREGFVIRPNLVQTLTSFINELTPDMATAPDPVLYLLVDEAARKVGRPEFQKVAGLPGFSASLKRVIDEFTAAGCGSEALGAALPDSPLANAFLAVYRQFERELAKRGLVTRAARLQRAGERVAGAGLTRVWLDGFHVFTEPELRLLETIGQSAEITLAMSDEDLTDAVRAWLVVKGFDEERADGYRAKPVRTLMKAPSIEREVEEIARRIVEQHEAGRPFREMGVIVRSPAIYAPLLRTTLERFGIPAKFYLDAPLERHPAVRALSGLMDAMIAGWDHEQTLAALRLMPRFTESYAMDRFDFAIREQIPNAGLSEMRAVLLDKEGQTPQWAGRLMHKLDSLASLEELRGAEMPPHGWVGRFALLRNLFRPRRPEDGVSHEEALEWRTQAEALEAFEEAAQETAVALAGDRPLTLEVWWRAMKAVLRLKALRHTDERRNVVHVLSAHEARQWVLPVVFVCGMVEKQFPQFQPQDPFFPDAARFRLNESGIRVRTSAQFDAEEQALFESAISRATLLTVLSYPEFDLRGERNLPSLFLEDLLLDTSEARAVRPAANGKMPSSAGRDEALWRHLAEGAISFSPTSLEVFLQCPFQYFATRTLRLRSAPERPEERLNFLKQGQIVHEVLAEWWQHPQEVAPLFERLFTRYLLDEHIPPGYHTERLRNSMMDDLTRFIRDSAWPRAAFASQVEKDFQFELAPGIEVRGRIDRLDTAPDGAAYVIDYKYSRAESVKDKLENDNLLQAPLYLMAAEKVFGARGDGVFYVGLRGGLVYAGWSRSPLMESAALPDQWLERTRERVLEIVQQVRQGRIEIAPADTGKCKWCDAYDVCRVEQVGTLELVQVESI